MSKLVKVYMTGDYNTTTVKVSDTATIAEVFTLITAKRNISLDPNVYSLKMKDGALLNPLTRVDSLQGPMIELVVHPTIAAIEYTRVFGVPLERVKQRTTAQIPDFLESAFNFINTHGLKHVGIFRLSGSASQVTELKQQIDSGTSPRQFPADTDPNAIAALVKMYFRELPEPLLTFDRYIAFKDVVLKNSEPEQQLAKLKQLIGSLPPTNYTVLRYLVALMRNISKYSQENKMNPENLAIVVGPNIMAKTRASNDMSSMVDAPTICNVVTAMIEHYSRLFKEASPYDESVHGYGSLDDNSSAENMHIPRDIYFDPTHLQSDVRYDYSLEETLLTGESIVFINAPTNTVEREIPFDYIHSVATSLIEHNFTGDQLALQLEILSPDSKYSGSFIRKTRRRSDMSTPPMSPSRASAISTSTSKVATRSYTLLQESLRQGSTIQRFYVTCQSESQHQLEQFRTTLEATLSRYRLYLKTMNAVPKESKPTPAASLFLTPPTSASASPTPSTPSTPATTQSQQTQETITIPIERWTGCVKLIEQLQGDNAALQARIQELEAELSALKSPSWDQ